MAWFVSSIFFLISFVESSSFFSVSHFDFNLSNSAFSSESSPWSFLSLSALASSVSFLRAWFSISSCKIFLLTSSISVGMESISVLSIAQASSIKSMALSGKNLSVMYLSDKVAAAITAESEILMPW